MHSHGMPIAAVRTRVGRTVAAEEEIRSATAHQTADRTPAVEGEIRSATARQAAGKTLGAAGIQGRLTAAVLRPVRWIEEAPSAAWIGAGARRGIPVTAEIRACPLREAAEAVEAV